MTMPPISFSPPPWLLDEARNRVVLLLNHVLQQEPEAMQRLRRQAGKTIQLRWPHAALARALPGALALHITPAGLLAQARADAPADLVLTLEEPSAFTLAGKLASGDKPTVGIEGDVQLAAEVAWLVDNVRWDLEEDLSRLLGDAAAHTLVQVGRQVVALLRTGLAPAVQAAREHAQTLHARMAGAAQTDGGGGAP
jgi:ubiquinone biosynthesis protein UbiJ